VVHRGRGKAGNIVHTNAVSFPEDPALVSVLEELGIPPGAVLGHGGEAWVYALGEDRILRILHPGGRTEDISRRKDLVAELSRAQPPFALPEILEIGESAGRVYAVERRLPGRSVLEALDSSSGDARRHLVECYLDATASLGELHLEPRDSFGDLIVEDAIATSTWPAYLAERAAANLSRSTSDFWSIDPGGLAADLPDVTTPSFVHLDAFTGNVLTDGRRITAVIDIGSTSMAGDRRLDPLSAVVYLVAPEITPGVEPGDVDVAMAWLRAAGLHEWFDPARRWLAAFWSAAVDDPTLLGWCRGVLLEHRAWRR